MYPMHISGSISDIDKQFAGLWYTRQSAILQKLKSANLKFVGYVYNYKQIVSITWYNIVKTPSFHWSSNSQKHLSNQMIWYLQDHIWLVGEESVGFQIKNRQTKAGSYAGEMITLA